MVMENRRFSKGDRLLFCSSEISITGKSEYPDSYRIISLHSTAEIPNIAIPTIQPNSTLRQKVRKWQSLRYYLKNFFSASMK